jgi:hypothetical protein
MKHTKGPKPSTPGVHYNGYWFAENHDGYSVHHINGNRRDNRIENLEMIEKSLHAILHNTGRKLSNITKERISKSIIKRNGSCTHKATPR